jgi:hypothetical protein
MSTIDGQQYLNGREKLDLSISMSTVLCQHEENFAIIKLTYIRENIYLRKLLTFSEIVTLKHFLKLVQFIHFQ